MIKVIDNTKSIVNNGYDTLKIILTKFFYGDKIIL